MKVESSGMNGTDNLAYILIDYCGKSERRVEGTSVLSIKNFQKIDSFFFFAYIYSIVSEEYSVTVVRRNS